MCGISGIVNFNKENLVNAPLLKHMTQSIIHRGPDDEGIYINNNIGFGFRRLSIIDLETGHQPMVSATGDSVIVFNGEIYNYRQLREELSKIGKVFKTQTDTEVILNLYEQYGEKCVDYLNGMFAFVIWDKIQNKIFCARDRFGIKPFYYYEDNQKFIFASEIKSILQVDGIDKSLSYEALDSYFAYGYITSDKSIYNSIKKLKAGHTITLNLNIKESIQPKKYWKPNFLPDYSKSEIQWANEIESLFSETVQSHMVSDVPIGAFLSGGIDSSSVVAMMSKNSNSTINTFSIGFKEVKFNELNYAKELALKYGCNHHELIVEQDSINILSKLVHAYDEPFADSSAIPTYYVSKFAREYVKVVLSGDGGDELFAGYDIYGYLKNIHSKSLPLPAFNSVFWGGIGSFFPEGKKGRGSINLFSRNKKYLGAYLTIWPDYLRKKLVKPGLTNANYLSFAESYKKDLIDRESLEFESGLQNLDLQTYLVDDILTKVDRVSMLNSLEVRVPILDYKFAELSFKIPYIYKLKNGEQKYIFKKAMQNHLPEGTLNHKKQGFALPLEVWFKESLKEYVNDKLNSKSAKLYKYLNDKIVNETLNENIKGRRDFSARVWSLLFFEEWLQSNNL